MEPQQQIAALEADLKSRDAQLAEQATRLAEQKMLIAQLRDEVAKLTEKLSQTSRNSHLPPSSDPPGRGGSGKKPKKSRKSKKPKRKRGGQPGHEGHHRELLPAEQVDDFVNVYPDKCENCWKPLPEVPDPKATRFQVTEVPQVVPDVIEHRVHTVACTRCGHRTRGDDSSVPESPFGARLQSVIGMLTGVYHVSRRQAVTILRELLGVRISLGAVSSVESRVSSAIQPPVTEAWEQVEGAKVKHTDGTSWLTAGGRQSLWTIASKAATVYKIVADSSRATLEPLYGALKGILVSDRATALGFWAMKRRQVCWAHLLRKFVAFSERDGPAGVFGRELLDYTGILFAYWHDYKNDKLDKRTFRAWMRPVRDQVEALLERAVAAEIPRLSGSCADMLAHRDALWTFVDHERVEPTNNHAERELRAFVLWRKRSFGTQSERGNLFAERVMTVAHTARKQGVDILAFLTACCEAREVAAPTPSLFDAGLTAHA